jgi:phage terminase large subunit
LDCFACLWIAVDEYGKYYVYREYAEKDKIISNGCAEILDISKDDGKIDMTLAPPDIWGRSQESGKGRDILFYESGLPIVKSNNNREAGWLHIKELLRHERLFIFRTCCKLIDCITELQIDVKNPNDCLTEPHDITHLPDALRYFCAFWINNAKPPRKNKDPFQLYNERKMKSLSKRNMRPR